MYANKMRKDFTLATYRRLLEALVDKGFSFIKMCEINANKLMQNDAKRLVLLRQDVDRLPANSLAIAKIQSELGIKSTYYFRIVPQCFDPIVIEQIAGMGHEVGYHYEDMSFAWAKLKIQDSKFKIQGEELEKKLAGIAIESFARNLEKLRKIAPVKTICMHGSPLSRWDSRLLWKYYDYHDFGIIGEPYFDVDFDKVLYLTDTGRRWDGENVSVRDKAEGGRLKAEGKGTEKKAESGERRAKSENPYKDWKVIPIKYRTHTDVSPSPIPPFSLSQYKFHSTTDIINAAENGQLPDKIMMTFHPQRWTDKPLPWVKELVWQNLKNVGKYFLVRFRD